MKGGILDDWFSGISIKRTPLGNVRFIDIPYKNEYLAKIHQEWVFEVNGFHRIKKGDAE